MTAMVAGVYKAGKVELLETPQGLREGRVRVFLTEDEDPIRSPRHLEFGKYRGNRDPVLEDFKDAEWHGGTEFNDTHDK